MSFLATNSTSASPAVMVTIIVGVLASCAFLGWLMWRACQSVDRAQRDPRYMRRLLLRGGLLYVGCALYGIEEVATGKMPIQSLLGLIIPGGLAWFYIRAASRVKVPPA